MTDILVILAIGISAISLASVILLMVYLPTLRKAASSYHESSSVISQVLTELDSRASAQDRRIADIQVKLDVMESRIIRGSWPQSQVSLPPESRIEFPVVKPRQYSESQPDTFSVNDSELLPPSVPASTNSRMSRSETLVLQALMERRLTAPEVKGLLGSSREHAARIMKSLADRRLVMRDLSKKPYSYAISDVGRDIITSRV